MIPRPLAFRGRLAAVLVLSTAATLALLAPEAAGQSPGAKPQVVKVALSLARPGYYRGGDDAAACVGGLVATITITNSSSIVVMSVPTPRLAPYGGSTDFERHLVGLPTGSPAGARAAKQTRILRHPSLVPTEDRVAVPDVALAPNESREFHLDVGSQYRIDMPGKYEMTCVYLSERSNPVEFEVYPVRRVDVTSDRLLETLEDYECGPATFPVMFYVTVGRMRYDDIVCLVREGRLGHYEFYRIGQIAHNKMPQVVTSGPRVGLLVPDTRSRTVSRLYTVDLTVRPVQFAGSLIVHEEGTPPDLTEDLLPAAAGPEVEAPTEEETTAGEAEAEEAEEMEEEGD